MKINKINEIKRLFSKYYNIYETEIVLEKEIKYEVHKIKFTEENVEKLKKSILMIDLLCLQLSKNERDLLELRYKNKLSSSQIARRLFMSESTYFREMRKIYKKMEKYYIIFEDLLK